MFGEANMASDADRDTPPWMNPALDDGKDDKPSCAGASHDFKLGNKATVDTAATEPDWMRDSGDDDDGDRLDVDERSPLMSLGTSPGYFDRESRIPLLVALLISFVGMSAAVVAPCLAPRHGR